MIWGETVRRSNTIGGERRDDRRYDRRLDLRWKLLRRRRVIDSGVGCTLNLSRGGVRFHAGRVLTVGLMWNWPSQAGAFTQPCADAALDSKQDPPLGRGMGRDTHPAGRVSNVGRSAGTSPAAAERRKYARDGHVIRYWAKFPKAPVGLRLLTRAALQPVVASHRTQTSRKLASSLRSGCAELAAENRIAPDHAI